MVRGHRWCGGEQSRVHRAQSALTVSVFDARMAPVVLAVIDLQQRKFCRSPWSEIDLTGVAKSAGFGTTTCLCLLHRGGVIGLHVVH